MSKLIAVGELIVLNLPHLLPQVSALGRLDSVKTQRLLAW